MSLTIYPKISCYVYPIADPRFTRDLARSSPKIAGLFEFEDTSGIWDMCRQNRQTVPIVQDWYKETEEIHESVKGKLFWSNLMNLANDARFREVLSTAVHPTRKAHHTTAYSRIQDNYKPAVIVLWYIVRLVKAEPELFHYSTVEPLSLDRKDVLKGWKFLAWTRSAATGDVLSKKVPHKVRSIKPKWGLGSPSKPLGDPGGATGKEAVMDEGGDSDDGGAMDEEQDIHEDDASAGEDAAQSTTSQEYAANDQVPSSHGLNTEHETCPSQLVPRPEESEREAGSQEAQLAQSTNQLDTTTDSDSIWDFDGAEKTYNSINAEIY